MTLKNETTTFIYDTWSAGGYMIGVVESKKNSHLGDTGESCVSHINPQDSPVKKEITSIMIDNDVKDISAELFMSHKRLIERELRRRQEYFLQMKRLVKKDTTKVRVKKKLRIKKKYKVKEKELSVVTVDSKVKSVIKEILNKRRRRAYYGKFPGRAGRYLKDLRKRETLGEGVVRGILDSLGLKYSTQKILSACRREDDLCRRKEEFYIIDFDLGNLVIEVDGSHHEQDKTQIKHDIRKDRFLRSLGKVVLRLPNWQVFSDPESVKKIILDEYEKPLPYSSTSDLREYVTQDSLLPLGEECSDMRCPKVLGCRGYKSGIVSVAVTETTS